MTRNDEETLKKKEVINILISGTENLIMGYLTIIMWPSKVVRSMLLFRVRIASMCDGYKPL